MDRTIAVAALVILAAFLAVLVWKVPRADLIGVIALTLGLAAYDFFRTFRQN